MSAAETQMPQGMDPDVWATMTEEERAGIAGSEYSEQELAAMGRLAAGGSDDGDDDGDDGDSGDDDGDDGADGDDAGAGDDAAGSGGEAASGEGKNAEPAAKETADEPAEAQAQPVAPRYEAKLPDDFNDRVAALDTATSDAWQKFNDGDLDQAGLQAELARISNERADLNALKVKAEISQEMNAQTAEQAWAATVNRSMTEFAKPENGGIDYRKDTAKAADLDQFVKVLANNEANADKPMDWFLREAHKRVLALHGLAPAPKRETPEDANKNRKPKIDNAPPSLSQVPGGDGPGDVGGEFADIDNLDGEELEAAIARMTPAQRERYAQAR